MEFLTRIDEPAILGQTTPNLTIGNFCDKNTQEKFPKEFLMIRELLHIINNIKVP